MARHPLREAARNRQCMVRIPGVCNHNPETTVLAHRPSGKLAVKADDADACWACYDCHKWLDEEWVRHVTKSERDTVFERAVWDTQLILHKEGLM